VRIAKFFAKISYYVANAFESFFWNLAILFSNSSLGSEKLKQNRHSLIKSRLTVFIFGFFILKGFLL